MTSVFDRRRFLSATSAAFAALTASGCHAATPKAPSADPYGPLLSDPNGLLDLPKGFSYRVISRLGDVMSDGGKVPDAADGMGCFALPGGKLALVRNHELRPGKDSGGASGAAFDRMADGSPMPGGTTTLVLDTKTLEREREFRTLSGTIRNCSGGITPWGTWLTCEEDVTRAGSKAGQDHGWVFEVPATATGPVDPVPLKAMGRFNHEAAVVDPRSGAVFQTEDREDGLLYRFVPVVPGQLARGGRLQALALADPGKGALKSGGWAKVRWIDLDDPESPNDDLRKRGAALGAMTFARGEGIHLGLDAKGKTELFFVATSGGAAKLGQVWRLRLEAPADRLQLFFESTDPDQFNYGDNLTVSPGGHLIVCEDQYTDGAVNHLRGLTAAGLPYDFARVRLPTEPAGACFSPDGKVLFVNLYSPTTTLAITGPWTHLRT
jgi:secreted PhoX family phosphatase